MTTVQRKTTQYTRIGSVPAGGLTTTGFGVQVRDDIGDVQLQDQAGNVVTVSNEDFSDPTKWVATGASTFQAPQPTYTVTARIPVGGESSTAGSAQATNDEGDYQLTDPQGNVIVVSVEDYMANYVVITP